MTKFLKINSLSFYVADTNEAFKFIMDCYERLHRFWIVGHHGVEF